MGWADNSLSDEQVAREWALLDGIVCLIGQSGSVEADLCAIEELLRELIPFDCWALYRRQGESLNCVFARGEAANLLLGLTVGYGIGVSGWVAANRTPLMNGNAATEFGVVGQSNAGFTLVSGIAIPLESETGTAAVLTLYSRHREAFQLGHLRALLALSSRLTYRMRVEQFSHSCGHDPVKTDSGLEVQLGGPSRVARGQAVPVSGHRLP